MLSVRVLTKIERATTLSERQRKRAPGAEDVGMRASIRVHDKEPGKFRDLLGYLESETSIRDKHGAIKNFDPARIVAWKLLENPEVAPSKIKKVPQSEKKSR